MNVNPLAAFGGLDSEDDDDETFVAPLMIAQPSHQAGLALPLPNLHYGGKSDDEEDDMSSTGSRDTMSEPVQFTVRHLKQQRQSVLATNHNNNHMSSSLAAAAAAATASHAAAKTTNDLRTASELAALNQKVQSLQVLLEKSRNKARQCGADLSDAEDRIAQLESELQRSEDTLRQRDHDISTLQYELQRANNQSSKPDDLQLAGGNAFASKLKLFQAKITMATLEKTTTPIVTRRVGGVGAGGSVISSSTTTTTTGLPSPTAQIQSVPENGHDDVDVDDDEQNRQQELEIEQEQSSLVDKEPITSVPQPTSSPVLSSAAVAQEQPTATTADSTTTTTAATDADVAAATAANTALIAQLEQQLERSQNEYIAQLDSYSKQIETLEQNRRELEQLLKDQLVNFQNEREQYKNEKEMNALEEQRLVTMIDDLHITVQETSSNLHAAQEQINDLQLKLESQQRLFQQQQSQLQQQQQLQSQQSQQSQFNNNSHENTIGSATPMSSARPSLDTPLPPTPTSLAMHSQLASMPESENEGMITSIPIAQTSPPVVTKGSSDTNGLGSGGNSGAGGATVTTSTPTIEYEDDEEEEGIVITKGLLTKLGLDQYSKPSARRHFFSLYTTNVDYRQFYGDHVLGACELRWGRSECEYSAYPFGTTLVNAYCGEQAINFLHGQGSNGATLASMVRVEDIPRVLIMASIDSRFVLLMAKATPDYSGEKRAKAWCFCVQYAILQNARLIQTKTSLLAGGAIVPRPISPQQIFLDYNADDVPGHGGLEDTHQAAIQAEIALGGPTAAAAAVAAAGTPAAVAATGGNIPGNINTSASQPPTIPPKNSNAPPLPPHPHHQSVSAAASGSTSSGGPPAIPPHPPATPSAGNNPTSGSFIPQAPLGSRTPSLVPLNTFNTGSSIAPNVPPTPTQPTSFVSNVRSPLLPASPSSTGSFFNQPSAQASGPGFFMTQPNNPGATVDAHGKSSSTQAPAGPMRGMLTKFVHNGRDFHKKWFELETKLGVISWGDTPAKLKYNETVRSVSRGADRDLRIDVKMMRKNNFNDDLMFTVQTTGKTLQLMAPNENSLNEWLDALGLAVQYSIR